MMTCGHIVTTENQLNFPSVYNKESVSLTLAIESHMEGGIGPITA